MQNVAATVVGESIIAIQCHFIHGSDAVGCKVVLASKCPTVQDEHVKLLRNAGSILANYSLTLTNNISCYYRVLANDIDVNGTIGNFTIEREIRTMDKGIVSGIIYRCLHFYAIANNY